MNIKATNIGSFFHADRNSTEVEEVRRSILNKLLYVFSVLGLPAVCFGVAQSYMQGRWEFSFLYAGIYGIFLLGTFASRRLSYRFRALILVSSLFLISFAILMRIGMSGVGLQLMFGVCFISALLFGMRAGMLALLISLASILYVAVGMTTGFIAIYPEQMLTSKSPLAWITGFFVFLMIVGITVIAPEMLRRRIEESRNLIQEQKKDVEKVNQQLQQEVQTRRKAEAALSESEEKYRKLTETANDFIVSIDLEGIITYANQAAIQLAGGRDIVGMPLKDLVPMDLTDRHREMLQERIQGYHEARSYEWVFHPPGQSHAEMLLDIKSSLLQDHGKPSGVLFVARDITERKRIEQALRESEEKYRRQIEKAPVGFYRINLTKGVFLQVNDAMCRYTGYSPDEFMRMSPLNFLTPKSLEHFIERLRKRNNNEPVPTTVELEIRIKSGEVIWAELETIDFMDGNDRISDVIIRDITERKRAGEALSESEKKYKFLTEKMTDIVWIANMDLRTVYVSPSIQTVLGFSQEERMLQTIEEQFTPESLSRGLDALARELAIEEQGQGDPNRNETLLLEYYHKNGSTRWMETIISSIRDDQGILTGLHGVSRDVSDRIRAENEKKALEERLQRSEKMEALGQLAGGVAHDLNNVLGVLSGYSELLLLEIPEGSRSRGHVEKILQSTEKGAAIIQDLLTLARRGVTASDVINLNSVVSGFLKTPVFEKMQDFNPRVTFKTEYDKNLLNIKGSPVHLEKTLMNLVTNAAESISGPGEVTIRTQNRYLDKPIRGYDEVQEGDYAVLTVSDTGMGIPAENREKIFEPFYTKKTMGRSGTGLGLAIVWGTVKDHNGYIDLQTEVGEGTTFTLYFPVAREELITPQQKEPIEEYMGNGKSVLVVDDIAEQRDVASGLLTRLGYKVHAVSSGEEAVEYLKGNPVDILVLDMIMAPGIDGLETYQRVLEINPKQKAILVSGFSETERVREAQRLGAGAYVKKPYVMEKIGIAIRDELG